MEFCKKFLCFLNCINILQSHVIRKQTLSIWVKVSVNVRDLILVGVTYL